MLVGRQKGKRVRKKNVEKIQSLPDEGREFISETLFDFPGRNPFEESCYPLQYRSLSLMRKHE